MSTTARPLWSTVCCSNRARSAKTSASPTGDGFQRSGRERGITISRQGTSVVWKACASIRRHARPRRFWRRGRAHPVDGSTAPSCWSTLPKPDAADQIRGRQGAQNRPQTIVCINKVDKADARVTEVVNEVSTCSQRSTATSSSTFPSSTGSANRAGWRIRRTAQGKTWDLYSILC